MRIIFITADLERQLLQQAYTRFPSSLQHSAFCTNNDLSNLLGASYRLEPKTGIDGETDHVPTINLFLLNLSDFSPRAGHVKDGPGSCTCYRTLAQKRPWKWSEFFCINFIRYSSSSEISWAVLLLVWRYTLNLLRWSSREHNNYCITFLLTPRFPSERTSFLVMNW